MAKKRVGKMSLKYYERNLLFFDDDSIKAVYLYKMQPYAYMSEDQRKAILSNLDNFLWNYTGTGKLLLLNKILTPDEIMDGIDEIQQENPFPETYAKWKKDMYEDIKLRRPWTQVLYLIIDIKEKKQENNKIDITHSLEKGGPKQLLKDIYSTTSAAGLKALKRTNDVDEHDLLAAISSEEAYFNANRSAGLMKATTQDIEYMLKAPYYRELGEVPLSNRNRPPVTKIKNNSQGKVYLRPSKSYILNLFQNGWIEPDWRSLAIHHGKKGEEGKTSYQSNLVLTGLPDDNFRLDNEWLHEMMSFEFPVDVCVNFKIKSAATEISKLQSKMHDMTGEVESLEENKMNVSDRDEGLLAKGRALEGKMQEGQPLMEMEVLIAIAATSKSELEQRVEIIQKSYSPRRYDFSVVPSKAVYCFQKFFPWAELDEFWLFPCDPGFLSSSGIHCTSELGTEQGPWLGSTFTEKPILADFGWPMRHDRPGTIVLLGSMGGGKTATMLKIMKTILLLGGYGFAIDPKGDLSKFENHEEIGPQTKVIYFGAGAKNNKLNIFQMSNNKDRAWEIAKSYLYLMFNASGDEKETRRIVINKVLKATMSDENPNMFLFIENVKKYLSEVENKEEDKAKATKTIQDLIESYEEDPLAKIIYHDGTESLKFDQYRQVIANFKGLKMPKKGMDLSKIDDTMKLTLGILMLVGYAGRELLQHRPNDVLKFYAADEYWILESEEMESLNKELTKMSRSQYVVPIFGTQEAGDIKTPDVRNNLAWVLCGKSESKAEIEDAMTMLGIEEATEEIYMLFRDLESGEFFCRDPFGRRDIIHIYQSQEWLDMFKTTPTPKKVVESSV